MFIKSKRKLTSNLVQCANVQWRFSDLLVVGEEVQTRLLAGISVLHSWFLLDVICLVYPMG